MSKSNNTDGFRRIVTDFGGAGSIQGTEDLPFDPQVADVKAVAFAALFGFAAIAGLPSSYQVLGWGVLGVLLAGSLVVVYLCPADRDPLGWLGAIGRFKRRPKRLTQHADREKERTQSLVGVERVLPIQGAARRTDGTIVGLVEVEGRDMALAETSVWETAGAGFESMADGLDGGFEVFSPARTIAPGRISKGYVGRELDDDVKNNPTLSALIETYQEDLPAELNRRGTAVRRFYVVVWVTESEVRRQDHGLFAKLADLRLVGPAIRRVGLARREASDEEINARQKSILSARKRAVRNGLAGIEDVETSEVDAEHLAAVLTEYWTGIRTDHSGKRVPNTSVPVVTAEPDSEEPSETGGY